MANSVANVAAAKPKVTGGAYRGPLGTALPVDSTTVLNVAFKGLGYIGEDGVEFNPARSTDKKRAFGGDVVKVLQTEYSETWTFTLIESLNAEVLKTVHGDSNVTTTAPTTTAGTLQAVKSNGDVLPNSEWIFEMIDGAAKRRVVLPNAKVTEVGEVTFQDGELVAYPVTLEAFEDTSGNNSYSYLDDGVFSA